MARPAASGGGRRVDLHTHTRFSDGALGPGELVALAAQRGLAALAITDHDTVEALAPARQAAGPALELVPGIEMSCALGDLDLHLLGYYLDPEDAALLERLARFRAERLARAEAILERLHALGIELGREQVLEIAGEGVVGRPHVAHALLRGGHVGSLDDAFRRYLSPHGAAYVPRPAFHPREAIELIHAAGGVSVLAHPGPHLADAVVESLAADGLRGIEVWHPQHAPPTVRRYQSLAQRLGLLETGGSDFHGEMRGAQLGDLPVPLSVLGPLKLAAGVAG